MKDCIKKVVVIDHNTESKLSGTIIVPCDADVLKLVHIRFGRPQVKTWDAFETSQDSLYIECEFENGASCTVMVDEIKLNEWRD